MARALINGLCTAVGVAISVCIFGLWLAILCDMRASLG